MARMPVPVPTSSVRPSPRSAARVARAVKQRRVDSWVPVPKARPGSTTITSERVLGHVPSGRDPERPGGEPPEVLAEVLDPIDVRHVRDPGRGARKARQGGTKRPDLHGVVEIGEEVAVARLVAGSRCR